VRLVTLTPKDMIGEHESEQEGENLKVIWAEFSILSYAFFAMSVIARHTQATTSRV
jgi:hypothetical protein